MRAANLPVSVTGEKSVMKFPLVVITLASLFASFNAVATGS
jgi:hypothetical protein